MFDAGVLKFIEACNWDSAKFLILSDNVFGPLIYYSHLLPLVSSLILTGFIFFRNKQNIAVRWLLFTVLLLDIWLFSDLVLWATEKPPFTMFFWSLLVLIEPMIYAGMIFFAYATIDGKDLSFRKKIIIFALLLPTIVLMSTRFGLTYYDLSNCDREAIEGPLAFYGYITEILFSLWILGLGFNRFIKTKIIEERKKIALVVFGISFFLLSFSLGNIIGSLSIDWVIGQYGLFGIPIFLGFLAYLIVRYKAFDIKLIGAQALVVSLWIVLLAVLFIRKIENVRVVVSLTLVLFLIVGVLLIRSVAREVKQREEIAQMAEDVKRAYIIEKRAKEELENLDKFKDQFLMTTQHNLRTPLTSMMGYSDLLLKGVFGKQTAKTKEVILKFQVLTQGMIKMVNDFLNMAQFQLGKDVVVLKSGVDLSLMLSEIATELEFKAKTKNIYLKLQKPQILPSISADREKLKAAMFNIIDNAVKYTTKGGVLVIVEVNGAVKITVSDTGIGIPKNEISNLFDNMFARGAEAKKLDAVGSGVGLYLSAQIIKAHKGKISVASDEKGSHFYIELPINISPILVSK